MPDTHTIVVWNHPSLPDGSTRGSMKEQETCQTESTVRVDFGQGTNLGFLNYSNRVLGWMTSGDRLVRLNPRRHAA